jgi:hypothetical protein
MWSESLTQLSDHASVDRMACSKFLTPFGCGKLSAVGIPAMFADGLPHQLHPLTALASSDGLTKGLPVALPLALLV